jgi:hypothetical protein
MFYCPEQVRRKRVRLGAHPIRGEEISLVEKDGELAQKEAPKQDGSS